MTVIEKVPLVTVLLPVYNAQLYVREAIESILSQSFHNFELILIDDGSTDESRAILEEFKILDSRIVLVSRQNKGVAETLNEGLELARGKWLARMDADDVSMPMRLERQLSYLEKTGADICGSWVRHFGTADKRVIMYPSSDAAIKIGLLFASSFAHPSVMMRTSLVKAQKYDKAWDKCEDYELWERAAAAGWKMANLPEVLLLYRQHGGQISKVTAELQQEMTHAIRERFWRRFCLENKFNSSGIVSIVAMRRDPIAKSLDIESINQMFALMLQSNVGEARNVLFDHITRLYIRVSADYPCVVARWNVLNVEFGQSWALSTKFAFFMVSRLRARSDGFFFKFLKRAFFLLCRRS